MKWTAILVCLAALSGAPFVGMRALAAQATSADNQVALSAARVPFSATHVTTTAKGGGGTAGSTVDQTDRPPYSPGTTANALSSPSRTSDEDATSKGTMTYHRETFEDQSLELDGNTYTECTFSRCILVFRATGEPIGFSNNHLIECRWNFEGGALRTVQFLRAMYRTNMKPVVENFIEALRTGGNSDTPFTLH